MTTIPTLVHPEITVSNGQAVTSSQAVADYFSKRHDDVLKKIRLLECSPDFSARNFAETKISVMQPNGGYRTIPAYQITRDGFAFLAMGFTGSRAARFKEAYINAFNQMEEQLQQPTAPRYRLLMTFQNGKVLDSSPVASDAFVVSPAELPDMITRYPHLFDDEYLWEIIQVCTSKLKSHSQRGRQ